MQFEFNLADDQIILLNISKGTTENNISNYELIDENQNVWGEFYIENNSIFIEFISAEIINSQEVIDIKFDEILEYIVDVEKTGTDSFYEDNDKELNPYDPEKIKVRTDKIPVSLISQMVIDGDIDLNPDFQRHLVWSNAQKSLLIESILLRIPLPMFYFAEDKEGKLSVVDGLQRLSTIKEFMENKFALKGLQYLEDSCGGKYYRTEGNKEGIDSKYFRWFNLTTLSANIIDPSSPYKVKYDIFRRINTGGKPLNNQEIRNCLTGKGLRQVLKQLATLEEFKSATDKSIKSKRMDDEEFVLRFLAFYELYEKTFNISEYSGYMESFLDEFTENHISSNSRTFQNYIYKFSNAMKNAEYLIGKKYSFRKIQLKDILPSSNKQLINKALFVCTSVLLADFENDRVVELNEPNCITEPLARKIFEDSDLFYYLSYGTNGRSNLMYTFRTLKKLFEENIKY